MCKILFRLPLVIFSHRTVWKATTKNYLLYVQTNDCENLNPHSLYVVIALPCACVCIDIHVLHKNTIFRFFFLILYSKLLCRSDDEEDELDYWKFIFDFTSRSSWFYQLSNRHFSYTPPIHDNIFFSQFVFTPKLRRQTKLVQNFVHCQEIRSSKHFAVLKVTVLSI